MSRAVPIPNVLIVAWLKYCSRRPNAQYTSKLFSGQEDGLHKNRESVRKKFTEPVKPHMKTKNS
ncbi:hypothetical protein BH18THE2_BH18THE2_04240 [soil metagenome]